MLPQRGMEVDRRAPNPSQGRLPVGQDGQDDTEKDLLKDRMLRIL